MNAPNFFCAKYFKDPGHRRGLKEQLFFFMSICGGNFLHCPGISQGSNIANSTAFGNVPEQTTHNLAGAGFGQPGGIDNVVWPGNRPNLNANVLFQLISEFRCPYKPIP
jgi:hypothetical protein